MSSSAHGGSESSDALQQLSVQIPTPWGFTSCEYLLSCPQQEAPWPILLFLTGKAEIEGADKVKNWVRGGEGLDPFAFANFAVIVPLVRYESALFHDTNSVNVEALWLLFRAAVCRLGSLVDCQRIYITGYSMGADAAMRIAASHGPTIAAVAVFSGEYQFLCTEQASSQVQHLPVRAFHALGDHYIPARHTKNMFSWLCDTLDASTARQERVVSVSDPSPPSWDDTAQAEFDVTECGPRSMWLFKDYICKSGEWKGYRRPRKHVIWPSVYNNEGTFGLFRWLLEHRSPARIKLDEVFEVALRRLPCCDIPSCPINQWGFSTGFVSSGSVDTLLVGPGFHFDRPASPLQVWNRRQSALGHDSQRVLAGDVILKVNGEDDASTMRAILQSSQSVELQMLRPFGIEVACDPLGEADSSCDTAGLSDPCRKRKRSDPRDDPNRFVDEQHRRGFFSWVLRQSQAVNLDVSDVPETERLSLREAAHSLQRGWLSTWERYNQMCFGALSKLYETRSAALRADLPSSLQGLLAEPDRHFRAQQVSMAWWSLDVADIAFRQTHKLLLSMLVRRIRDLLTSFLGSRIPLPIPPLGAQPLKKYALLWSAAEGTRKEPHDVRAELLAQGFDRVATWVS